MSQHFDFSHHENPSECEPNLSDLKKEVEITPSTLKEITNKQEFLERVIQLCSNAKQSIQVERVKQSLVYLNEAEKILQYAASCGKTIDKNIIICVLHNQACCYQKIWELEKCSNYLQALIYNFNSFLRPENSDQRNKQYVQLTASETIDKKTFLAKYYLQFCAVNSQTDNHSGALIAGRKAIQILKDTFKDLAQLVPSMKKMTYQKKAEYQHKIRLISLGSRINDGKSIVNYENVLTASRHYLWQWKQLKQLKDRQDRNYILEQEFKNYSIGNAMQITPANYKDFCERQQKYYPIKTVVEKILLMALGYFTISTELRLIADKKYNQKQKQKQKTESSEFKQSQIYHLLSISIVTSCLPFDILYMKHVLSSYSNHYGVDLMEQIAFEKNSSTNHYEEYIFSPKYSNWKNGDEISNTISIFNQSTSKQDYDKSQTETKKRSDTICDETKDQASKKVHKNKNKSKSKSKHMKSMNYIPQAKEEKGQKSPLPKSPNIHVKSPKNNLIKVKTSYRLKLSTQKIFTTKGVQKEEKSKKKKDVKSEGIDFDYFMGKNKNPKKTKKTNDLNSPRNAGGSRSTSRKQSPLPKNFDQLKPNTKTIKSPKKTVPTKLTKNNFHQYYL